MKQFWVVSGMGLNAGYWLHGGEEGHESNVCTVYHM